MTSIKERVQYPLFKGRERTKIREPLESNAEDDVRELLQGDAKYGIPNTLENVNDIYKALGKVFNDPTKLLNQERKSLTKSGTLLSYDIKGGTSIEEDWNCKLGNRPVLVATFCSCSGS